MLTPYANSGESETEENDYGYGLFIDKMYNRQRIWHDGGGLGSMSQIDRYIDDDVSIIVLSNYGFTAVWQISQILAAIIFEEKYTFPEKTLVYNLDPTILEQYVIPMYPISETKFHNTWIDEVYAFEKDENGDIYFWGAKKEK